jgi:predicted nucleic acid-binding protein
VSRFFDTNVLVYAYTNDPRKKVAVALLSEVETVGGSISVQILNELANVLMRKFNLPWPDVERALSNARKIFGPVAAITETTHDLAVGLCRDHGLALYDALVVAAAQEAACTELLTEDMQHGRRFGQLVIVNPFVNIAA